MPKTFGRLFIDPGGISTVITITGPAGGNLVTYTAQDGPTAHSFPETITTLTGYYFTEVIPATISAKVNNVESANGAGATLTVNMGRTTGQTIAVGFSDSEVATAVAGLSTIASSQTLTDGVNIVVGTATGSQIGTLATQKLGFYGATPVVQRSTYTQTNSTAARTVANATSVAVVPTSAALVLTATAIAAKTASLTLTDSDVASLAAMKVTNDQLAKDLGTMVNKLTADLVSVVADNTALRADVSTLRGLVNSLIDDGQALGFVA